jgi:hypothetical protein
MPANEEFLMNPLLSIRDILMMDQITLNNLLKIASNHPW